MGRGIVRFCIAVAGLGGGVAGGIRIVVGVVGGGVGSGMRGNLDSLVEGGRISCLGAVGASRVKMPGIINFWL